MCPHVIDSKLTGIFFHTVKKTLPCGIIFQKVFSNITNIHDILSKSESLNLNTEGRQRCGNHFTKPWDKN